MKIRIRGNSIRYRLSMSEVETFSSTGIVKAHTFFGKSAFYYILRSTADTDSLCATYENNTITVFVPDEAARNWATSARIGFDGAMQLDGGGQLSLLVEKDFTCLDDTGEDQSDNYPNPRAEDHNRD
jgi:hypothetical protein